MIPRSIPVTPWLGATFSKCGGFVTAVFIGGWAIQPSVWAATAETLRVGLYENSPQAFTDERGQPAGFWVELLTDIAHQEGWTVEYVPCEWEQCLRSLEAGQIDLMMDVAYSADRDLYFDFNRQPVLSSWSVVYVRRGTLINSIRDLDQKRVAVLGQSIQKDDLEEQTRAFGIRPTFITVENFETLFQQLEQGTVDAGVVNRFLGAKAERQYGIEATNILVHPAQLHFAAAEGKQAKVLAAIDRCLVEQLADPRSRYYQLKETWLMPPPKFDWQHARYLLAEYGILVPLLGLFFFALWNRTLRHEVRRRQLIEERLTALTDNMPGVIYRYQMQADGNDALLYISSGCADLFELDAQVAMDDVGRLWRMVHPEDEARVRNAFLASARSLQPFVCEWRIRLPSGREAWVSASAKPQALAQGGVMWDGIVTDITERKAAEIALQESELRFQKLADNVPGILYGYRLTSEGQESFTYISSGFRDVYGFGPESALADPQVVWEMVHPDDHERLRRTIAESYQTLQVWQCQYRAILPTGELKWLQGIARPTRQPNGDVVWDGLIIDISDRKATELALQKSEQRFRNIAANVPGVILQYVLHPDGTDSIRYVSPGSLRILEVPAEKARSNPQMLWKMVHPEDLATMQTSVLHSAQTLTPWLWQWRIITPSDKTKWLEGRGQPERMDNGDVVWDTLILDISDRKQAELALKTSENRLATLIGNLPGFVYRCANDANYTTEFISAGVYDITGYRPEDYTNPENPVSFRQQIHPHDQTRVQQIMQAAIAQHTLYECEYRVITRTGSVVWVWERGQGIFDETGALHHLEGFITDVSDRKRIELALKESETRYRQVVEAQTDFILRSRPDTTITFANEALCKVLGVSPMDMVGKKWEDFALSEDLDNDVFKQLATLTPENPRCFVENRDIRADGQVGWTQWLNEGIFDEAGTLIEIQSVGRDITALKRIEQALRESEERLRLVTENMSDLVCLHDPDGRFYYVTPSSQTVLGYAPDELIGQDPYTLFHPDDRDRIRITAHAPILASIPIPNPITYRIRKKTGEYIWLETLTKPIFDAQGQVRHLQTTSRDVSDRIQAERQLEHDALHDSLTGLPNRNLLMHRLELALHNSQSTPGFLFAVLFLDLDNFKVVNDSLGHLVGDELLITVAAQLQSFIRETDLAARLGGDEFVILLEGITAPYEVVLIAERILTGLRSPFVISGREVFISSSIGIVISNASYQNASDLLRNADLAMYRAKQAGRNQYALFDPTMHLQVMQRLHLEQDLRKALEKEEFVLYYQPIVTLETRQTEGFEALVRWQHPQRGIVSPAEFIAIAEETGLIVPLGEWVLTTACQQLAIWQRTYAQPTLKMSVNLSVKQLQPPLIEQLRSVLAITQIPPESLVLEITESMLVQNVAATRNLLQQIRDLGVRLSIDDFGTGYSCLSYLHTLPVDSLKIDRAFVSPDNANSRNQVIAESILALSNLLELSVIAEGIQTEEQLVWLRTIGCEEGQGFLFSPPVPAAEAIQFIQAPSLLGQSDGCA